MEALALSLAIIPFFAGRAVLAVGLLSIFFGLQGVWRSGELTVTSVLLGIAAGFISCAAQALSDRLRKLVEDFAEFSREMYQRINVIFVTTLSLLFAAKTLGMFGKQAWDGATNAVALAGFPPDAWKLVLVGVVAWTFATLRGRMESLFSLLPLSEISGIGRALFFAEVGWTLLGLLVAVTFPRIGAALAVGALLAMISAVVMLRRVTSGGRGACATCGGDVHLAASKCSTCRAPRAPSRLGLLGRSLEGAPAELATHRFQLLALHRCPACAERLGRDPRQPCAACSELPFASNDELRAFVKHVDLRVAASMPVFAALGLVPGFGLVLALLLYKLAPTGALGGYVRWHQALGTRVLRGAALMGLGLLQPVPVLGALASAGLIALMQLWARRALLPRDASSDGDAEGSAVGPGRLSEISRR